MKPTAAQRQSPPTSPSAIPRVPIWGFCAALALGTLIFFWPVVYCGFVNYDDPDYFSRNPHVLSGFTGSGVLWAFQAGYASNWHPLTWYSHMLDASLFGTGPTGPHVVNLLLHTANTVLLFLLLARMTGARWRCAIVAALFGWHPLHVESVAWISERKDVLSTFFALLSLLAYVKYAKSSAPSVDGERSPARMYLTVSLTLFAFALLSKPMVVTLPFVMLLLDYWPLRRVEAAGEPGATWASLVMEKASFFALVVISCVLTFVAQRSGGAMASFVGVPFWLRLENVPIAYLAYLGRMFLPIDLCVLYPLPAHWPLGTVVLSVVLLAGVTYAALKWWPRQRYLAMGWLWFLGTLVPVIGLVQVGTQASADRYTYLPLIGVFIALVWGAADLLGRAKLAGPVRNALLLAGAAVLVVLGARSWDQISYWHDTERLLRHALAVTRDNAVAHNNLGAFLENEGRPGDAMVEYQTALKINPNQPGMWVNCGVLLAKGGKLNDALESFGQALRLDPKSVEAHKNKAIALASKGRVPEAISEYQLVLELKPGDADALNNLGVALAGRGDVAGAMADFQKAVEANPRFTDARKNLGAMLAGQRKFAEAAAQFQEVVKLDARDISAWDSLGATLAELGRFPEAALAAEKAAGLAQSAGRAPLAAEIRQRANLYHQGRVYRPK